LVLVAAFLVGCASAPPRTAAAPPPLPGPAPTTDPISAPEPERTPEPGLTPKPKSDPHPPPLARVESLPPLDHDALCEGMLVIEIESLLVRKYPRPALTPPFRFLPIVVGVLSLPGGPDEGDVTLIAAPQVYRDGDRVRILEGRTLLDRPVRRLHGLRFEMHLAENHTTVTPAWMSLAALASQAAKAIPGPSSDVIGIAAQIARKLDHDDIMLTWAPALEDLVRYARQRGTLRYRLLTPAVLPDGAAAAELGLIVRVDRDATCP
jgi:hypothetical protein